MKNLFTVSFSLLMICFSVKGQGYSRSSITYMFTEYGSTRYQKMVPRSIDRNVRYQKMVSHSIDRLSFSSRFFINPVKNSRILFSSSISPKNLVNKSIKEDEMLQHVDGGGITKEILDYWYNRTPDGIMDMKKIHERGLYDASLEEFLVASKTKRDLALLQDEGAALVNQSYICVIDIFNVRKVSSESSEGYAANYSISILKPDFNEEVMAKVNNAWIFEEDDSASRAQKNRGYDSISVSSEVVISVGGEKTTTQSKQTGEKSAQQLINDLVKSIYEDGLFQVIKKYPPFQVQSPVQKINPISSPIGTKEDIKVDDMYIVKQHVYSRSKKDVVLRKKGSVRVKRVANNDVRNDGQLRLSSFYQTSGGNVQPGMTLQEKKNAGLSILPIYEIGEMGGYGARLMYRIGKWVSVPALYLLGEFNYNAKTYELSEKTFPFSRFGGGVGKGFNMARIFEVIPYVMFGREDAGNTQKLNINGQETEESSIYTYYLKGAVGANVSLTHWFFLYADVSAYATFGTLQTITDESSSSSSSTSSSENEESSSSSTTKDFNTPWSDVFPGRQGITFSLGVRIEF